MTDVGDMIRYHRKRAGLSRVDLATIAGVGKTVIYDIEHGKETVQFRSLARVLDALNIFLSFDSPLMSTYLKEHDATR
ncbi:MAG: helix-turn-helix transcriptional regulator [Bacteroidetes bacterium]|nr:helix-turn-helix transcriptional regulator [Bacteroidota bacterium]